MLLVLVFFLVFVLILYCGYFVLVGQVGSALHESVLARSDPPEYSQLHANLSRECLTTHSPVDSFNHSDSVVL